MRSAILGLTLLGAAAMGTSAEAANPLNEQSLVQPVYWDGATVARDARSTDGGDMSAGKRVVTTGITASGRGVLTVTTRRRVIRADCVSV
jgi:hypothetical protein